MNNRLLIIAFLLFLASCKSENSIPTGILPQKKMQSVMWDMMRADKFLADFVLNKDSGLNKKMESIKYYQKIFAIHQINKEEFQQSFAYYRSHPALFKMIMDSLTNISKDAPTEITKPSIGGDTLQKGSRLAPLSDTVIPLRKEKRVPLN